MKPKVWPIQILYDEKVTCLECEHLHRPNPLEDIYICLCSLKTLNHEIDFPLICYEYEDIKPCWNPIYIEESMSYI